jgi:VWFA-related protein
MRGGWVRAAVVVVMCVGAAGAQSQQQGQEQGQTQPQPQRQEQTQTQTPAADGQVTTLKSRSTLVTVPTLVTEKGGKHVWGLTADDFQIYDNGVLQKSRLNEAPLPPERAIVLVVQENIDTYLLEDALDRSLVDFLHALPESPIPIAVVTAGARAKVYAPFTDDRDALEEQLKKLEPGSDQGGPHLLDGVYMAARMLQDLYPDRQKTILLVSGAHDGDSGERVMNALAMQKKDPSDPDAGRWNSSHGVDETLAYLERNNIVVDAIEFSRVKMGASDSWKSPELSAIALDPASLLMHAGDWLRKDVPKHLAAATGGEVRGAGRKAKMSADAFKIAADFPALYDLSFYPTDPRPGLHAVRVVVKGFEEKMVVRARLFYWAVE